MPASSFDRPLELWGGVECTINRVGDQFFDQLQRGGHAQRLEDLDRIAELGIKRLRYPVLWEMLAPEHADEVDWSWADERLNRLRELDIEPIVGLVHHGSGPRYTNLLDPEFPTLLAAFAGKVAARYPWVRQFTPVNEPLTTARFSGLYGHWYPHGTDALLFAKILLNELRAVVLAMRAIREVNPAAELVQTEDLGKTFSHPPLQYQADFENDRRWLTFDLLNGRVGPDHPMAHYFRFLGVDEAEWRIFADEPCAPDLLGVNYYVTSERFLDERVENYPPEASGGNGRDRYADVAAVRGRPEGIAGLQVLLGEIWERYEQPIAVTECHLGCTREEQMRWLVENWEAAQVARAQGVDVRALTVWSLLGAWDWNSLLTRSDGHYEPGVFDLRSPEPRRTALADLVLDLSNGRPSRSPVLTLPGWWRREIRHGFGSPFAHQASSTQPILLIGATGAVEGTLRWICEMRGLPFQIAGEQAAERMSELQPWAVIDCCNLGAEVPGWDASACARLCAQADIAFATFSRELVFDGRHQHPYVESDAVRPLNPVGAQWAEHESRVAKASAGSALIVRTGPIFAEGLETGLAADILLELAAGRPLHLSDQATYSPTFLVHLLQTLLDLLIDREQGVWHLANGGFVTDLSFGRMLAQAGDLPVDLLRPVHSAEDSDARPTFAALDSARGRLLPPLEHALACFIHPAVAAARARARAASDDEKLAG